MTRQGWLPAALLVVLGLTGCTSSEADGAGLAGTGEPVAGTTAGAGGVAPAPSGGTDGVAMGDAGTTGGAGGMASPGSAGGTGAGGAGGGPSPAPTPAACSAPVANPSVGNPCPGTPPPAIKLTMVADGFLSPTYVAQAPGDPSRLYVLEQQGTVRVVKDGQLNAEALLDLRDLSGAPVNSAGIVATYGEGGLLGMVFDPRFEQTKRFWLSYTKPGPAFTVAEFTLDDADRVDVTSYQELLSFPQYGFFAGNEATNHVGSMLAFGPDGCLYVSRGDGGGENDRQMSGQSTGDDLCSILRIDVEGYPTAAPGNLDGHVWNYGFRNPWRFSFDRATGDLYIGDVGQDVGTGFEEINIEPRGVSGRNYGWSVAQGSTVCSGDCSGMTKPALAYGISSVQNSIIGGYVYRGSALPDMVGRYIWSDWTERMIKTLVYKGETGGQPEICDEYDTGVTVPTKVRSFGEGLDGEIYVVAAGAPAGGSFGGAGLSEAGTLFRIDPQ